MSPPRGNLRLAAGSLLPSWHQLVQAFLLTYSVHDPHLARLLLPGGVEAAVLHRLYVLHRLRRDQSRSPAKVCRLNGEGRTLVGLGTVGPLPRPPRGGMWRLQEKVVRR